MSRESPLTLRPEKSSLYRSAITIYLFWVCLYRVCVLRVTRKDQLGYYRRWVIFRKAIRLPSPSPESMPYGSHHTEEEEWRCNHMEVGWRCHCSCCITRLYGGRRVMSSLTFYHSAVRGLGWCGVDRLGPRGLGTHALAGRRRVDGAAGGDFAYTRAVE